MSDDKSLELALASLDKQFGRGSVIRLGSSSIEPWPAISTGSFTLDKALGIGGLPLGRICEIYGVEGCGKSTVCLHTIAEAQKKGLTCAYIDVEHALDPQYMQTLGVDLDSLLVSQPQTGEQALETANRLVKTGQVNVIVVDSVAALASQKEIEGDMEQNHVGLQARLMGQALRILKGSVAQNKVLLIFINQLRMKVGVMWGNPETTSGGNALKYYASVRLDLRRIKNIEDSKGNSTGIIVKARVIKNKLAPPLVETEFEITFGKGINNMASLADFAVKNGIINKAGAWYSINGDSVQGREKLIELLNSDQALAESVRKQCEVL